ncbi:MAG: sigma-70 family RNA polymerase sigma factor [Bacteroidetes bacterium]|jgi:RNA polymerase sigma-70 factor (ECF subfamily)|nr:sigma-70 family RNA polymerase sigma factor [Bacteroidota bacterium]
MTVKNKHTLRPEKWVDNYSDYLYQYAKVRINDDETAMDLVQDTFLSALKARDNFEGRSSEKTWLVAILKRKIIDVYRKKSTDKEAPVLDHFREEGDNKGAWKPDHLPQLIDLDEAGKMDSREFMQILQQCIERLPDKWAATFTLRIMEELETEEVCKELNLTASNLWVILHRARVKMRECLEKYWIK